MNPIKQKIRRKVILDLILIIALNIVFYWYIREKNLLSLVADYARAHPEYLFEQTIPLLTMAMLSVLYFVIRRWRETVRFVSFAERRAEKDALTKLYSRRQFEYKLLLEWQRFTRYKNDFCLIKLKIDDFKVINDEFGNAEGDRLLIEISEKLLKNIRKTDCCARWGGAEFVILLPVTELPLVIALAERLRADIYCLLEDGVELSVSIGVVQSAQDKSLDQLLKEVDGLLYKARKSGGNCVVGR